MKYWSIWRSEGKRDALGLKKKKKKLTNNEWTIIPKRRNTNNQYV